MVRIGLGRRKEPRNAERAADALEDAGAEETMSSTR
jgi:hypothetical protein